MNSIVKEGPFPTYSTEIWMKNNYKRTLELDKRCKYVGVQASDILHQVIPILTKGISGKKLCEELYVVADRKLQILEQEKFRRDFPPEFSGIG